MELQTFYDNFESIADAPNGVQKLRELILQLAVQGKLVDQDPNDEPASELLSRILEERKERQKSKRVKFPTLKEIEADEKPYQLPNEWDWSRLGGIIKISSGDGLTARNMAKNGNIPVYGGNGVTGYHDKFNVEEPTLVIGRVGFYCGSIHLTPIRAWITDNAFITDYSNNNLDQGFLYWLLKGTNLKEKDSATAQPVISGRKIYPIVVGIPPLKEQKRIVAKVDQLMTLCDELEARQQKKKAKCIKLNTASLDKLLSGGEPDEFDEHWGHICNNFDLLYDNIENLAKLRQGILQLAVQGKLVKQDPNDEAAQVVLDKLKEEQARLLSQRKIKKPKKIAPIDKSKEPFTLPEGWTWARFPEVGEFGRGKSKHRPRNDPSLYVGGTIPMVQTGDVARANGIVKTYTALYNEKGLDQSRLWPKGTMCITIAANIADSSILGFDACFPDSVVGLVPSKLFKNARYFEYFIRTAKARLMDFAPSTAQKNINLGILEQVYIPLPPVCEMDRIVTKVDQLMALCDELEKKINKSAQVSTRLVEATVSSIAA